MGTTFGVACVLAGGYMLIVFATGLVLLARAPDRARSPLSNPRGWLLECGVGFISVSLLLAARAFFGRRWRPASAYALFGSILITVVFGFVFAMSVP